MKKIVVIGPEGTGKSTLCKQLADHFKTEWVPEYAREYLLTQGKNYSYNDLLTIAKGQIALEEEYVQLAISLASGERQLANATAPTHSPLTLPERLYSRAGTHPPIAIGAPLIFIDTDMYVMKVWCEFVFDKCHPFILNQIMERKYDLYLLCNTDLPWTKDELREYPDLETRQRVYKIYQDIMINQPVPWIDISGHSEERFQKAVSAVKSFFE